MLCFNLNANANGLVLHEEHQHSINIAILHLHELVVVTLPFFLCDISQVNHDLRDLYKHAYWGFTVQKSGLDIEHLEHPLVV